MTCDPFVIGSQPQGASFIANTFKPLYKTLSYDQDADLVVGGSLDLNDPSLAGIQVALQFWSPLSRLTDPYTAVVEP